MIDSIICMGANAFRIYLTSRCMNTFFRTEEVSERKMLLAFSAFYAVNTFLYLTFNTASINLVCNITGIFLLTFLYPSKIRMKLFVTVVICALNMACDVIVEKILAYREKQEDIHSMFLLIVPVCSILMLRYMTREHSSMDHDAVVASIGVLVMNFVVFYLYHLSIKAFSAKYENIILKQNLEAYGNQLEIIARTSDRIKSLRHDMKHHINEIRILAGKNDLEGIREYISSMEDFLQTPDEVIESGDVEMDSLLNYMLARARKEQIAVQAKVSLSDAGRHSFDMNIILGNLLENAIEAARQTEEKKLTFAIKEEKGVLKIHIENSYNGTLIQKGTRLLATKKEKELHGLGLGSVENIVRKYQGEMKIEKENNMFSVRVLLYLS